MKQDSIWYPFYEIPSAATIQSLQEQHPTVPMRLSLTGVQQYAPHAFTQLAEVVETEFGIQFAKTFPCSQVAIQVNHVLIKIP